MSFLSKIFKTSSPEPTLEEKIKSWSDEDTLLNFTKFLDRVKLSTEFIQDEYGFITAEVLQITCGEKGFTSPPLPLDWPLEPVVFPEEHRGKVN